jgi:hypothetical protein
VFDAGAIAARLTLDRTDFTRNLAAARAEAAKGITVPVNFSVSQTAVTRAITAAKAIFKANPITVPITFSVSQSAVMRAIVAARATLKANPITIPVRLSVSPAEMRRVGAVMQAYFLAHPVVIPVIFGPRPGPVPGGGSGGAGGGGGGGGFGLGGLFGLLGKKIPLFGGLFGATPIIGEIALWHILVDWVITFSAVLIPAAIALGAFGLAAAGTAKAIFSNFANVSTIVAATGKSFNIVSAGASAASKAVKPEVYQLWGDAITLATQKGGGFAQMASATGRALDQLGARFVVAVTSGKHMGGVMSTGATDVMKLGDVLGNLGGAVGNLLKSMPGFAEVFLNIWVGISKAAEILTSFAGATNHVLLWAHGLILYGGLAVTAIVKLGPVLVAAGGAVADFVFATSAAIGVFVLDLFAAQGALATFAVISDALTPWGWVAIGVTALGGLIYLMVQSKTAAQSFLAALQNTITTAPTVAAGITATTSAQTQVSQRLNAALKTLAGTNKDVTVGFGRSGAALSGPSAKYQAALTAVNQYRAGQQQLDAQQKRSDQHLASLSKTYGSATNALGLLNGAGITEKQWQDKSANGWAIIQQQVRGTELGYEQMGVTGGSLGNTLQIMNGQVTSQYVAMGKLNGAMDTYIGNVTKTQSSFDMFATDLSKLAKNSKVAGASMDGLNAQSITLNQSFGDQVTNANALFDTWRQAGIASNLQVKGMKAAISTLLPFARHSQEARAQLVALAQEAGYGGPTSMKALDKWLGNTSGALRTVKSITNQATIQLALLTAGMRNQGLVISNVLIKAIDAGELAYGHITKLATAYGTAVAQFGAQSTPALNALKALDDMYIRNAQHVGDNTLKIAAMIAKLNGIPLRKAIQIVVEAEGSWSITRSNVPGQPGSGQARHPGGLAAGWRVPGYGGGDRHPALLEGGEAVVPKHLVAPIAPYLGAHKVPGFASGGYIGSLPGLSAFDARRYASTTRTVESSDAAAAVAAMKVAISAAKAAQAAQTFAGGLGSASLRQIENWWMGAGGPGGGTARVAAAITGAESGFNPRIVQQGQPYATTGWGLWQITPGNSEPQAGIDGQLLNGPSNAIAAVAKYRGAGGFSPWTTFEDGAYLRFMGGGGPRIFDKGGYLPTGVSLAVNNTGRPERVSAPGADVNLGAKLDQLAALLSELIGAVDDNAGNTAAGVADAIGGGARVARFRAEFSPR